MKEMNGFKNETKGSSATTFSDISAYARRVNELYTAMLNTSADDAEDRRKLAKTLYSMQKDDGFWTKMEIYQGDGDVIVDLLYFPTYYATAALLHQVLLDGNTDRPQLEKLKKGLECAAKRGLWGHGYDAAADQIKALDVYKKAGLYEFLRKYKGLCPEFTEAICDIIGEYRTALLTNRTVCDFNEDFAERFRNEVEEFDNCMLEDVWYAAYDSNISEESFLECIQKCSDKESPKESRAYMLPYDICFAGRGSVQWNRRGTAFLDDTKPGRAFGRIFKIRMSQFREIQEMERKAGREKLQFGMVDGLPVYTFTSPERGNIVKAPSGQYLDVILKGLKEIWTGYDPLVLETYLYGCRGVLNEDDQQVLGFLRNSEHGVSLGEMAESPKCPALTRIRYSVKKLAEYGMVKQDGRSVAAGTAWNDREAVYYTRKEKRTMVDLLLLKVR